MPLAKRVRSAKLMPRNPATKPCLSDLLWSLPSTDTLRRDSSRLDSMARDSQRSNLLDIKIDYRDGLVNLSYDPNRLH